MQTYDYSIQNVNLRRRKYHSWAWYSLCIDPQKLEIVKKFPQPNNQRSLKGFLGMTTFLRKSIRNYSHIAAPLNTIC